MSNVMNVAGKIRTKKVYLSSVTVVKEIRCWMSWEAYSRLLFHGVATPFRLKSQTFSFPALLTFTALSLRCIILFSPMASNWNEEDEQAEVVINPETDTSAYNQLWQEALEVDDEVMRILQEHGEQVIDDETEIATDAMEEGGIKWVIYLSVFVCVFTSSHAHLGILRDYFSSFVKYFGYWPLDGADCRFSRLWLAVSFERGTHHFCASINHTWMEHCPCVKLFNLSTSRGHQNKLALHCTYHLALKWDRRCRCSDWDMT